MARPTPFSLFAPPYRGRIEAAADPGEACHRHRGRPGVFLVWCCQDGGMDRVERVRARPGGMALIVVLPEAEGLGREREILRIVERCRPHSVLPYHADPSPDDLRQLARRPPDDLPAEVTEYLAWRGITLDGDTRHIVRRTLDMSAEVRTVSALARGLYQSRRALGRRLMTAGLPVPSHWLHFGRVLRAAIRLQSTDDSLFTVACDLGYPDAFALSNQMKRLTGIRPTTTREYLGWEWLLEAWLRKEAEEGGMAPTSLQPPRARPVRRPAPARDPSTRSSALPGLDAGLPRD